MSGRTRPYRRWVVSFVALQLGTLALIFVANLVPDGRILDQVETDLASGDITTEWPSTGWTGTPQDTFGECFLLVGGYDDGTYGTLETITGAPNFRECERLDAALRARAAGEVITAEPHFRYWHGLTVVARPWMAIGDVVTLRVASALVLIGAAAWLAHRAARLAGPLGAAALLAPVIATGDLHGLMSVFHHPLMLAFGLVSIGLLLDRSARGVAPGDLAWLAAVLGAVYNVIDLFNFVPGVWLVATGAAIAARPVGSDRRDRVRAGMGVGVGWAVGYGVMWLSVWVWAAIATSPGQIWDDVVTKILFRVSGDEEFESAGFGAGFLRNLEFWSERPLAVPIAGVLVVVGAAGLWRLRSDRPVLLTVVAAIAPAGLVVPWMLASGQHHENHAWFEYRSFPMLLGLALFVVVLARRGRFSASAS